MAGGASSAGVADSQAAAAPRVDVSLDALVAQLTFYFSESNLAKDRFLRRELSKASDLRMPVALLLRFNRVRAQTEDVAVVADALRRVKSVAVSDDGETVRYLAALPAAQGFDGRTLYAERLPKNPTIEAIRPLFERVGRVAYVSLPRAPDSQTAKGFCFVEYESDQAAAEALQRIEALRTDAELSAALEAGGRLSPDLKAMQQLRHMRVMTKTRWSELRAEYVALHSQLRAAKHAAKHRPLPGDPVGIVPGEARRSPAPPSRRPKEAVAPPAAAPEPPAIDRLPNVLVRLDGIAADANAARIKEFVERIAPSSVEYVDYKRKTTVAIVRLRDADAARNALEALQREKVSFPRAGAVAPPASAMNDGAQSGESGRLGDAAHVAARLLAGDEETAYWDRIAAAKDERRRKKEQTGQAAPQRSEPKQPPHSKSKKRRQGGEQTAASAPAGDAAAAALNRAARRKALREARMHVRFDSDDDDESKDGSKGAKRANEPADAPEAAASPSKRARTGGEAMDM